MPKRFIVTNKQMVLKEQTNLRIQKEPVFGLIFTKVSPKKYGEIEPEYSKEEVRQELENFVRNNKARNIRIMLSVDTEVGYTVDPASLLM